MIEDRFTDEIQHKIFLLKFENDRFLNALDFVGHCKRNQGDDVYFLLNPLIDAVIIQLL